MRRRNLLINSSGGGGTDPSTAASLEVAFYNGSNIVIRKQEEWLDGETPIGIVVVPGYHNRYGDGSCGIMSLVGMDNNNPESGIPITGTSQGDDVQMYWGNGVYINNNIFYTETALTSSSNYIPYQTDSASTACTVNSGGLVWPYAGTTTAPTSEASTEYSNTDGYVAATGGKAGCDFNGIRNTVACYVKTRTAAQWTASTVSDAAAEAAACAGRFKTVGTKSFLDVYSGTTSNDLSYGTPTSTKTNKGFWYLPALGELSYLPRYKYEINNTILALNQKYGNVGIQISTTASYWSSSEHGSEAWRVAMTHANLVTYSKKSNRFVRAFMRL